MHHAVGPLVRFQTRAIYAAISKASSWYAQIFLDATTLAEIAFWRDNYNFTSGYTFKPHPVTSKMLFTDASEDGYGGFLVKRGGHAVVAGKFGALDLAKSSTHRELAAVKYPLQSLESVLINESINIFTDNFSASRILEVGSSKSHLQRLALDIFQVSAIMNGRLV